MHHMSKRYAFKEISDGRTLERMIRNSIALDWPSVVNECGFMTCVDQMSRAYAKRCYDLSEVTDCAAFNRVNRLKRVRFGYGFNFGQFTSLHPSKAF